jgi:hypothetical protein
VSVVHVANGGVWVKEDQNGQVFKRFRWFNREISDIELWEWERLIGRVRVPDRPQPVPDLAEALRNVVR